MRWEDLFARQILIVSGKGGTGKSTIAAALASVSGATGRRTLLIEVEGRGEIARTLQMPDPGFREVPTAFGFSVLSITPREAAIEYVHLFLGMDRLTRPLMRAGALEQIIGGAPGFRDLLSCGKLYEIAQLRRTDPRGRGRPEYDLLVVDAPPTGQIAAFLSSASAFADLARVGRIKRQASAIERLLRRNAHVLFVAVPEEMSVAETSEAVPAIRRVRVPVAAVVANRCLPPVFPKGAAKTASALRPEEMVRLSEQAGVSLTVVEATDLIDGATVRDRRHRLQRRLLKELAQPGPLLQLPDMTGRSPRDTALALAAVMQGNDPGDATARIEDAVEAEATTSRRETRVNHGRAAADPGLDERLAGRKIIIVCGSGGVGKTTVSAAVAIRLAELRSGTALLTVDPARRLATSLGLPRVAGGRTTVAVGRGRRMEALQLDTQRTFDELIDRYAGNRHRRDRILSNRFYQRISDTLAGTHEYMAMEKLYELAMEEDHEAIVVDTPPTSSALSFLDAPNRLNEFLGGRVLRWMVWPSARAGRLTLGAARFGAQAFARTAGRLVGAEVLADTADFLAAFEGMYGGFRDRAALVLDLLRSPECAFLVVTTPTAVSLEEAGYFVERLGQAGMHAEAVVVNRWHPEADSLPAQMAGAAETLSSGSPAERATAAVLADRLRREPQRRSEAEAIRSFAERHGGIPIMPIPELAEDVHDVPGLRRVGVHL
ncbi:MAG: ArsA-related P-loop ATPase, partial [Actinomycetota bacterium]